jgi:hypothetical protein
MSANIRAGTNGKTIRKPIKFKFSSLQVFFGNYGDYFSFLNPEEL